jgi:general secretion pathway protein F
LPEDERSRRAITDIRDVVRGGAPLSTALERQHGLFSRLYVNMVRAGEAGGSLHETLQRLADYLERSRALQGKVINALVYPAILLVVVGGALLFLLGYVVPQFAQMYESLDVALPWFTNAVLQLGLFVRDWWVLLLVVPGVLVLFFERKARQPAFGWRWMAGCCSGVASAASSASWKPRGWRARWAHCCAMACRCWGHWASRATCWATAPWPLTSETAADEVKNGAGLSLALSRGKRFPRLALQMIQVGEESGALDTMLLKAADTFEQDSARRIDRMLAAMVPAITLVLASVVGAVIVAVLVPLYDLTNAIG